MRYLALLLLLTIPCLAEPANLSGTWRLDIKKSKWSGHSAPQSGEIVIEHNEPKLKYTGKVTDLDGTENTYSFDGAIDGKEHPVKMGTGDQKITFQRIAPNSISSTLKNADSEEDAVTTVASDGKSLVRKVTRKGPKGKSSWTEVYDRM